MSLKKDALETYLKHRPATSTEYDDFEAGWYAAMEAAANSAYDFQDLGSSLRAQDVIRKELL